MQSLAQKHAAGHALVREIMGSAAAPESANDLARSRQRATTLTNVLFLVLAAVETPLAIVFAANASGGWIRWPFLAFIPGLLLAVLINRRGYHTLARLLGVCVAAGSYALPCLAFGPAIDAEIWIVPMLALPPLLATRGEKPLLIAVYVIFGLTLFVTQGMIQMMPPMMPLAPANAAMIRVSNLAAVTAFVGGFIVIYRRIIAQAEQRLASERERAERLLANILPDAIALRLKRDEFPIADQADEVSVLFADVVNFTPYAAAHPPEEVVNLLNRLFYAFDDMVERRGLEKIKTIGDAYMVAGGVPLRRADHAAALADLAYEMLDFATALRREEGIDLALRVGIHTGSVVAGVIGKRKFSYDLWGDTVNTAARLESASAPGRIHVSEATRRALGPAFAAEERGAIALKGLGEMRTYFLAGKAASATA